LRSPAPHRCASLPSRPSRPLHTRGSCAEQALRDSEEKLRTLFDSIDEGFLWGEMAGKRLLTQNPAVIETGLFDDFKRVTETGVPITQEHYYAHEQFDGWFLQTVAKVEDGSLLSTLDITERKRHEANLAFLADLSQEQAHLTNIDETMDALGARIGGQFNVARVIFSEISEDQETGHISHEWHKADLPRMKDTYAPKCRSSAKGNGVSISVCSILSRATGATTRSS
jgi:hypothetical protein